MRTPHRLFAAAALAALALSACKGNGSTSQAPGGLPAVSPAGDRAQWVGISDLGTGCANGNTTTSQIENWSLGSAAVPLSGNLTPSDRYGNSATTKVDAPYGWFVDNNSNEWVANYGTGTGTAGGASVIETSVDKNGSTAPTKTITSASFGGPVSVYVSQANGVNNWIYVLDNVNDAIYVFPATASGTVAPTYTITSTSPALNGPAGIVLDSHGNIWVGNQLNQSIVELTNPAGGTPGTYAEAPIEVITGAATGLSFPFNIYLDAHSNIWVANFSGNTVGEFSASSGAGTLNVAPYLTIGGASTGLSGPEGVAVDNGGNVYVVNKNAGNPAIDIWWNNAIGAGANNVAPTYTIAGSNTHLICPVGIQVYSITGTNDV